MTPGKSGTKRTEQNKGQETGKAKTFLCKNHLVEIRGGFVIWLRQALVWHIDRVGDRC
jgi:hypothetical protein